MKRRKRQRKINENSHVVDKGQKKNMKKARDRYKGNIIVLM